MVYVPGEKFLNGTYGKSGEPYASRREVREAPQVSFTRSERIEAEGISRDLAERIVAALPRRLAAAPRLRPHSPQRHPRRPGVGAGDPALQPDPRARPRGGLQPEQPRRSQLLQTPAYREKVAEALVDALVRFYGGKPQ